MGNKSIFNYALSLVLGFFCLLFCAYSAPSYGVVTDELTLNVMVTTGEHSRDSGSLTTHVTVGPGNKIITWKSSSGGHRDRATPVREEYKLSAPDKARLIAILRSGELLRTCSIDLETYRSNYQYFAISITSSIGGKSSSILISGLRTDVELEQEKLYQNSLALIEELYRIIEDQGGRVDLPELIVAKRTAPQV